MFKVGQKVIVKESGAYYTYGEIGIIKRTVLCECGEQLVSWKSDGVYGPCGCVFCPSTVIKNTSHCWIQSKYVELIIDNFATEVLEKIKEQIEQEELVLI